MALQWWSALGSGLRKCLGHELVENVNDFVRAVLNYAEIVC